MTYYGIAHDPLWDRASPIMGSSITHYGIEHDLLWDRESPIMGSRMTYYGIEHHPLWDRASPIYGELITTLHRCCHCSGNSEIPSILIQTMTSNSQYENNIENIQIVMILRK